MENWLPQIYEEIEKRFSDEHLPKVLSLVRQPSIAGTGEAVSYTHLPEKREIPAVDDVSFCVRKGETLCIVGAVSYTHLDVYKRQLRHRRESSISSLNMTT